MKAYVFPGQGSQKVGMGKELYENYPAAKEIMDKANEIVDFDLKKLCFEGPIEELTLTHHVQPAITTVNLMTFAVLQSVSGNADVVAGHSLGEYSALAAAGVISFDDAIKLTALRGKYMQESADLNPGAMSAVLGMPAEKIIELLAEIKGGVVQAANFNSAVQTVISGNKETVAEANDKLKEAGAKRVVPLPVSGPWHSPLVASSLEKFAPELDSATFTAPKVPVVQNVTGEFVTTGEEIRENLKAQITGSVQWTKTMQLFLDKEVTDVIEVGPGIVLQGLAKAASRKWNFTSAEKVINAAE